MEIYKIGSVSEASGWMKGFELRKPINPCKIKKLSRGDESYQISCPDDLSDARRAKVSISLRKGHYIIQVMSEAQETTERFLSYVVEMLPAS